MRKFYSFTGTVILCPFIQLRKRHSILLLFCLSFLLKSPECKAQDSAGVYWQRSMGGYGFELFPDDLGYGTLQLSSVASDNIELTVQRPGLAVSNDRSILMVTTTYSKDGDIKGLRHYSDTAKNGADIFVTRFDSTGRIIWKKCFGGSKDDIGAAALALDDGYLIAGSTVSPDGDFNNVYGYQLPFVIKIGLNGNIKWRKLYYAGSSDAYHLSKVEQIKKSPDGTYWILMNRSFDNSANIPNYKYDVFVLNINGNGDKLTDGLLRGNSQTLGESMEIDSDSTLYVGGYTLSTGGLIASPVPPYYAGFICLMKKASVAGIYYPLTTHYLWTSNYSHTKIFDMVRKSDGTIYAAGTNFPYVTSSGTSDVGIIYKYDPVQDRVTFKRYEDRDLIYALDTATNGGLALMSFHQYSPDQVQYGAADIHLTRLDADGNINWERYYPGNGADYGMRFKFVRDNEMYMLAITDSDTLVPANHNRKHNIFYGGPFTTDMWIMKLTVGNVIRGKVFYDADKNGFMGLSEKLVPGDWIRTKRANSEAMSVYSAKGEFSIGVDTGRYVTQLILPIANAPFTVKPVADTSYFPDWRNNTRDISFAIQPVGTTYDGKINIDALSIPRLGRKLQYRIVAANIGSMPLSNAIVTVIKDKRLTTLYMEPEPTQISGDTLKWNIGAMQVLSTPHINLVVKSATPPVLNIRDTLKLSAKITHANSSADPTPENNEAKINHIIIGAIDPNDKSEMHNGKLFINQYKNGDYLDYRINFQNVGNDTAFYIEIKDTLEKNLNANDIIITASSHNCVINKLNDNIIVWKFDNIYLPPKSVSDSLSEGFVTFRVRPNVGLSTGDSLRNKAAIYFDYNFPVITNTAATLIAADIIPSPPDTIAHPVKNIYVYPNPVDQPALQVVFYGTQSEKFDVTVVDATGRVVLNQPGNLLTPGQPARFSLPAMPAGIYFVHLSNSKSNSVTKLIYTGH